MVRASVVEHPSQWEVCGYNEIQNHRKRKGIIDFDRLIGLLGNEKIRIISARDMTVPEMERYQK
jgi:hypothetical protein